ncbi:hypothetical protein B0H13DRAFT_1998609 [Mycena leptocephala]|nr:hypothetical protein B0H13DRAFT_1998609 [Mycena leptocephala]
MSTLQLIWDSQTTYQLWSWNNGNIHYTAQLVRRIKNSVYMVRIGARGVEPTDVVAVKVARGKEEVEEMEREVGFYESQLKSLQGTVVPKCYGFYTAKVQVIINCVSCIQRVRQMWMTRDQSTELAATSHLCMCTWNQACFEPTLANEYRTLEVLRNYFPVAAETSHILPFVCFYWMRCSHRKENHPVLRSPAERWIAISIFVSGFQILQRKILQSLLSNGHADVSVYTVYRRLDDY